MHVHALAGQCHPVTLRLSTSHPTEFVDITDHLEQAVHKSGVRTGLLAVHTLHTTTAVVVNERESLLQTDFEQLLDRLAPRSLPYWHDELPLRAGVGDDEPRNGHAHCRALLMPSSQLLTIADGALRLGRWQRVFLVELDGPRERELSVVVFGDAL